VALTIPSIIPAANLKLWLRSNSGVTYGATVPQVADWDDGSTNANNMVPPAARPDLTSGAIVFQSASSEYGYIAHNASLDFTTNLTIAMRVRPDSLAGAMCWLSQSGTGGGNWSVQYAGEFRFWSGTPGVSGLGFPGGALSVGTWVTIVIIYSPSSIRVRMDGVEMTASAAYGTIPVTLAAAALEVCVAAYRDPGQYADVAFEEIVLTDAALSPQQILDVEYVLTYGPQYGLASAGVTQLDFGVFPGASDASIAVTGQASIQSGSLVEAWLTPIATPDHSADEHLVETIQVRAGNIVPGVGFTIYGWNTSQMNEPLETVGPSKFRSAAATVYGYVSPSRGGQGTLLYGLWSVAWVWV